MDFFALLMDKTGFPQAAREEVLRCAGVLRDKGLETQYLSLLESYGDADFKAEAVKPAVLELARKAGFSQYTLWLLVLMSWARRVKPRYDAMGAGESLFWDTFSDLKYKVMECWQIHGVWGNFVAFWYDIFFTCDIVKLGRLEYERCEYPLDTPCTVRGREIRKGDRVLSIHIPSSGEPFDAAARMDSYRRAWEFFGRQDMVCICDSWLLYPEYRPLLAENSNIRSFMEDFRILSARKEEKFGDGWRLFGSDWEKPIQQLPERTAMQRAYKAHLLRGGSTGEGFGIFLFDGQRLHTQA